MNRVALLCVTALLIAGCGADRPAAERAPAPHTLKLGFTPFVELPVLQRETRALADYLAKGLSVPTRPVLVSDYRDMLHLLRQGRLDLAWCTPALWARVRGQVEYEPLCGIVRGGKTTHTGLIVVRADSRYRTLADLKGGVFAYVDRTSATGFMLPNEALEKAGIDPLRDFRDVRFSLNHTAALTDLLEGRCDAAAVHDDARTADGRPIDPAQIRVLATTGTSPADPILVSQRLPKDEIETLKRLLLEMPKQPGGADALAVLTACDGITGFAPP